MRFSPDVSVWFAQMVKMNAAPLVECRVGRTRLLRNRVLVTAAFSGFWLLFVLNLLPPESLGRLIAVVVVALFAWMIDIYLQHEQSVGYFIRVWEDAVDIGNGDSVRRVEFGDVVSLLSPREGTYALRMRDGSRVALPGGTEMEPAYEALRVRLT